MFTPTVRHDTERIFVRHLTMRHFEKELNSQLPTAPPWECPYPNCKVEPKDNLHYLRLHYGIEHNVARKLYDQRLNPQAAPSAGLVINSIYVLFPFFKKRKFDWPNQRPGRT